MVAWVMMRPLGELDLALSDDLLKQPAAGQIADLCRRGFTLGAQLEELSLRSRSSTTAHSIRYCRDFTLVDFDGDGKLSVDEPSDARQARSDVDSLGEIYKP